MGCPEKGRMGHIVGVYVGRAEPSHPQLLGARFDRDQIRGKSVYVVPAGHPDEGIPLIILGIVLLVVGFIAKIAILWTIGIILLVIGAILAILGTMGRAVGGRRHYF
jgi:hypothetical protein